MARPIDADSITLDKRMYEEMTIGMSMEERFRLMLKYQPTVHAIPIEWLKRYAKSADDGVDCYWHFWAEDLLKMIEDWEAENEKVG